MHLVKIAVAKQLFHAGVIRDVVITEPPMAKGFIVTFLIGEEGKILSNDKGCERVFKSVEAARNAVKSIGFKSMTLF